MADSNNQNPLVCAQCGSLDCQVTAWVTANGGHDSGTDGPLEDVFCPVCENSEAELVPLDESPVSFYVFDEGGNHVVLKDAVANDYSTIESALEAATDLVLNVWTEHEVASVCASGDGERMATVAQVERVENEPRPYWHGCKYRVRMRFCQGGEPRVTCRAPTVGS